MGPLHLQCTVHYVSLRLYTCIILQATTTLYYLYEYCSYVFEHENIPMRCIVAVTCNLINYDIKVCNFVIKLFEYLIQ